METTLPTSALLIFAAALAACGVPFGSDTMLPVPTQTEQNGQVPTNSIQANMPNPASVYCEEKGNRLEIRTAADGSQSGVCVFPDGSAGTIELKQERTFAMQPWLVIFTFIIALLIVWLVIALVLARRSDPDLDPVDRAKHRQGYWMSVGISIGVALGVALGPLFDNIGTGIAVGIALGAGIGASLEQRNKHNLRPLTAQEKQIQKRGVAVGLAVSVVLAIILLIGLIVETR